MSGLTAVVTGKFKLPSSVMVAAEKFPLPSRLTRVPAVSVLVAVSPSVTAPPTVAAVMSALPVTESTPVLVRIIVFPKPTLPPPLKPGPGLTVTAEWVSWASSSVPTDAGRRHILRVNGIRRWRQLLARRQRGESCRPPLVSTPISSQLVCAGEHAGAKINQHREQAVGDDDGVVGHRPGDGHTGGVGVEQREGQVVGAAGRAAVVLELALIGERRALGESG